MPQSAPWRAAPQFTSARRLWASKLGCHALLLLLACAVVLLEAGQWGEYTRAVSTAACFFLVPKVSERACG